MLRLENGLKNIPWNFAKFIVNHNGEVLAYYEPQVMPNEIENEILKYL